MATIRIRAVDEHGAIQPYCCRAVTLQTQGAIALVGPSSVPLAGGMSGCYVRTVGLSGEGKLTIHMEGAPDVELMFSVSKQQEEQL